MKKTIFTICALAVSLFALADDNYKLEEGSLDVLFENSATCTVDFDYTQGYIGDFTIEQWYKQRGGNWYSDFQKYTKEATPTYVKTWNKANKKGLQLVESGEATYKMVYTVKVFNPYRVGFGMMSSVCAAFETAYVTVFDASGKKVMVVGLSNQTGGTSMSDAGRIDNLYEDAAKDLFKWAKKNK